MSHHIYQTNGIILGQFSTRESNLYLRIFTKELGLIGAHVQGARELKSKLKHSLGIYTYGYFDLVRGKEMWRVISADKVDRFGNILMDDTKKVIFARMLALIQRLTPEETQPENFFENSIRSLDFFAKEELTTEEIRGFESMFVMRVLENLGYWGEDKRFDQFFTPEWVNRDSLKNFLLHRKDATTLINKSLQASHL